jgi:DNA-binding GntR family transcriptional regulator
MPTEAKTDLRIPRQSLASAVSNVLRERILRGELKAGDQLVQHTIATELGLSRIPVREALRQLEAEGLVKIIDHRGALVASLSADEILEMFEVRMLLESHLLRLAIPRMTDEDFEEAESILESYTGSLEIEENVENWGALNWKFHSCLYEAANRPRILSMAESIHNNADRYVRLHLFLVRETTRANQEHRTILQFSKERNVEAACRCLEQHIESAGKSLAEYLRSRR